MKQKMYGLLKKKTVDTKHGDMWIRVLIFTLSHRLPKFGLFHWKIWFRFFTVIQTTYWFLVTWPIPIVEILNAFFAKCFVTQTHTQNDFSQWIESKVMADWQTYFRAVVTYDQHISTRQHFHYSCSQTIVKVKSCNS